MSGREPWQIGLITCDPEIMHGAPCLAGTRIPTEAPWSFHRHGYSTEEIIEQYPRLTPADVAAAIAYERMVGETECPACEGEGKLPWEDAEWVEGLIARGMEDGG